jgi:signal peptidase I
MLWLIFAWSIFGFAGSPLAIDRMPSNAMAETLLYGDVYVASLDAYAAGNPQRGDVVLYYSPTDNRTIHVDRIVGLPGDKVRMIDGVLYINGRAVPRMPDGFYRTKDAFGTDIKVRRYRETLPEGPSYDTLKFEEEGFLLDNTGVFEVPLGSYFLLGDNRDNSVDSRLPKQGYASRPRIIGRLALILFSIDPDTGQWRKERFLRPVR